MKKIITLLFTLLIAQLLIAATYTTFNTYGSWQNAADWLGGSSPGAISGNNLTLSGNNSFNVNHPFSADYNMTLSGNSNLKLNVNAGGDLIVDGNVTVPQNKSPKINVVGTASNLAYMTVTGNIDAKAQMEITVENGVLRIEGDLLGANNANIKLNVKEGGILYIKGDVDLANNVNMSFDGAGTILIDGDLNMQSFNSNPLDGIIAVYGQYNSSTNVQSQDDITLWGDNIDDNSVRDHRSPSGIDGPAEGSYADFAALYPDLCEYSDYCRSTYYPSNPILPVTFVSVGAVLKNGEVLVSWSTAQEENNDYFDVEKSIDGKNWVYVGSLNGAGNSSDLIEYEFLDYVNDEAIIYYRIKQVDYDGKFAYSDVVYVASEIFKKNLNVGVYPNPNGGMFYFELYENSDHVKKVEAVSVGGEISDLTYFQSENVVNINDASLVSGFYSLKIFTDNSFYSSSFVVK